MRLLTKTAHNFMSYDRLEFLSKQKMPFGKYGPNRATGEPAKTFDQVPLTYLDWLVGQEGLYPDFRLKLETYLKHPTIAKALEKAIEEKERQPRRRSSIRIYRY